MIININMNQNDLVAIILPNIAFIFSFNNSSTFIAKCLFGSFFPVFLILASYSPFLDSSSIY